MKLAKLFSSRSLMAGIILGANVLFGQDVKAQQIETNAPAVAPVKVPQPKQTNSTPSYLTNQVHLRIDNSELPYSKRSPIEMYTIRLQEGIFDQLTIPRISNFGFAEREELFDGVEGSLKRAANRTVRDLVLKETEFALSAIDWAKNYLGPLAVGTITPRRNRDYLPISSIYHVDSARVDNQKVTFGANLAREAPYGEGTWRNPSGNLELRGRVGKDLRDLSEAGFATFAADVHLFNGWDARIGYEKQFSSAEGSYAHLSLFKELKIKGKPVGNVVLSFQKPEKGDGFFSLGLNRGF